MSESEGTEATRRRRRQGSSPAAQASLPDGDDLLREILLRLPPQPSSLPRASAVCKRWRRLVTDPKFHRQFRAHHRKPPLLGVFQRRIRTGNPFRSILNPPDSIPPECFGLRHQIGTRARLLGCRHGRVLLVDSPRHKVIVYDPITGEHHHIEAPPVFRGLRINGDVLCAAADQGHVHASCHSSPFKVVLMSPSRDLTLLGTTPVACVYSSETRLWGNIISTTDRCDIGDPNHGILVGNVLYWSFKSEPELEFSDEDLDDDFADDIIEFDLDRQGLAVIKGPPSLNGFFKHQIIKTDCGDVGLAMLCYRELEIWLRNVNCHGEATWLLQKTIEMCTVLGISPRVDTWKIRMVILGYDEDNGAIFVHLGTHVYMVELMSMQSRKLYESDHAYNCHPFTSFYAPGEGMSAASEVTY